MSISPSRLATKLLTLFLTFSLLLSQFSLPTSALTPITDTTEITELTEPTGQTETTEPTELTVINVLGRPDCSHCVALEEFLTDLETQRSDFIVRDYNILSEPQSLEYFKQITQRENLSQSTPIILIGNQIIQGFDKPETTGRNISTLLDRYQGQETPTLEQYLASDAQAQTQQDARFACTESECELEPLPIYISIPFLGQIDARQYSLPILSFILGFIDGFNPCAMWVLVTFLLVLVQVGDRRKMWTFAGLFILAEAIMYYLILTVWFSTWDFVGLDRIITPIVGLISIGGGIFFLYEWKSTGDACKVTDLQQRQKITTRVKDLASKPLNLVTALGIIALALSVNIIEFACSIGIPQAFTKILELNNLTLLTSTPFLSLYILAYMIDDFIVFGIALYSFEKIGLTTKYSKLSNLLGGILMILLGLILIFKRDWLMIL